MTRIRQAIAALVVTGAVLAGAATLATPASAAVSSNPDVCFAPSDCTDTTTQTTPEAVVQFWDYMYGLQSTTDTCTAYHSNIIGDGVFGGVSPVVNTPLYEGNCLEAFSLVLFHDATYFGYDGHPA